MLKGTVHLKMKNQSSSAHLIDDLLILVLNTPKKQGETKISCRSKFVSYELFVLPEIKFNLAS